MKTRVGDELMTRALVWTIHRLVEILSDSTVIEPTSGRQLKRQLTAAIHLLDLPGFIDVSPLQPEVAELRSLSREGHPWSVLAPVAEEIRRSDRSLTHLAREILFPDVELRPRLFHLAVLGVVLRSMSLAGLVITSRTPLSGPRSGPAYQVLDVAGRLWDVWFEGGGVWSYYGKTSPYGVLVEGLRGRVSALSPDIALILPGKRALLLECKYSAQPDTVGRTGLTQAFAYAANFRSALVPEVVSAVVAPKGVVKTPRWSNTSVGTIGLIDAGDLLSVVSIEMAASLVD